MTDAPIGIFDSGFGGLTVARAVIDQLPHESTLYLGDTARQPYGPKPIGEVREYASASEFFASPRDPYSRSLVAVASRSVSGGTAQPAPLN